MNAVTVVNHAFDRKFPSIHRDGQGLPFKNGKGELTCRILRREIDSRPFVVRSILNR